MSDLDDLFDDLKQYRDELRLQIHLASRELMDEWTEMEKKMDDFSEKTKKFADDAKIKETGEGLGEALTKVGDELKVGYERIRKALND